jgi:LacI family transcriptional regulator
MPKATLKDIAEKAGVHPSTVSRALDPTKNSLVNAQTRQLVRDVATELGYQTDVVASGLRRGKTNTIGVVVADLANPFIAPVVRGIENNLDGRGQMALIAETQDDHDRLSRALENLVARRVDGIITTAARAGDERLLKKMSKQVPLLLAVRNLPGSGLPAITHDDARGGRLAAEHLLEAGHRRVAQLRGPQDISSFRERGAGFREAILAGEATLLDVSEPVTRPILGEGRRLMRALLDATDTLPTGIFAHNDLMAFGVLEELRSAGLRCPEDVAVIGYNNTIMTEFSAPTMTTIKLPGYEVGRMAADTVGLLTQNGDEDVSSLSLPPDLVARWSTLGWRPEGSREGSSSAAGRR